VSIHVVPLALLAVRLAGIASLLPSTFSRRSRPRQSGMRGRPRGWPMVVDRQI